MIQKLKLIIRENKNQIEKILAEEGKGSQWIVYHSFGRGQTVTADIVHAIKEKGEEATEQLVKDRIRNILDYGFKPGYGQRLGKGLYTVASFEDSVDYGGRYGPFTLKFNVNLSGFFVLDKEVAKTVYGKYYTLSDQMRLLNIHKNKDKIIHEFNPAFEAQSGFINQHFGLLRSFLGEDVYNDLDGVVLKTREDGLVVVGFKPDKFRLIGWALDSRGFETELRSFSSQIYRKEVDEKFKNKANVAFVSSVARKNNIEEFATKSFINHLLDFGRGDNILQTKDFKEEYPKVYRDALDYLSVDNKKMEKHYTKFLTPEEIKISLTHVDSFDDHYDNVVKPVMDKITAIEEEYKKDIFDKLVDILNNGGFSSLSLSNKREIATKFHNNLDGVPLSKWWK